MNPEEEAETKQQEKEESKPEEAKPEETKPEETTEANEEQERNEEEKNEEPKEKKKEPEIKIPTDFSADIAKLQQYKTEGNALVQTNVEEAIKKYEEAHSYYQEFISKNNVEREYNPQIKESETVDKLIMSNLALCYSKQLKFEEAIKYDLKIIAIDTYYDKSYVRLYKNYKALNNLDFAVHFGNILKTYFTPETLEKHKELVAEIEVEDKKLKDKYEEQRKKESKNYRNNILMKLLPAIILCIAGLIYFFFFRKPAPVSAPSNISGLNNTTSSLNEGDFDLNNTDI